MSGRLQIHDLNVAAKRLGIELATLRAVDAIESGGSGFYADGRVKILFESHQFNRLTEGRFLVSHPTLATATWAAGRAFYKANQNDRLRAAKLLDASAAIQACSWGRYQLMGFHFRRCGYASPALFEQAMVANEQNHLSAFLAFVASVGAVDELQQKRWADFARIYNGVGYAKNRYDEKLAAAYARFAKNG
jgi:N-acetylmuramidase